MSGRRPRGARHRRVFTGELVGGRLRLRSGAHRRTINVDGDVIEDAFDATAQLWSNVGDRVVIVPRDDSDDRIALAEVIALDREANPRVRLLRGELPSGSVAVMAGQRAPAPKRAPRQQAVKLPGAPIVALARMARSAGSAT